MPTEAARTSSEDGRPPARIFVNEKGGGLDVAHRPRVPADVKAQEYAESTDPFDRWFKDQVRNLTGIDPTVQPLGPPSEVIFDMQSGTAVRDRT